MVTEPEDRDEAAYNSNLETIRTSTKWLVAAFAALGTVLVAGSQLSSIGALETSDGRFWVAVAGMATAMIAVLAMVGRTVRLLLPRKITVDELARMERSRPRRRPAAIRWFDENPSYRPYDTFQELQRAWQAVGDEDATDKPDLQKLEAATRKVQREAILAAASADFRRMLLEVAGAALIAAFGIGTFAWAADPPAAEDTGASLRNLTLRGVDLQGANLARVDLVGVDFSGTNLRGATLKDAALDDVVWRDTTCPDGTNSDDHAADRGDEAGEGTCEGHLVP